MSQVPGASQHRSRVTPRTTLGLLIAAMFLVSGCSRANAVVNSQPITLRVAGSTSMTRALRDLAVNYQSKRPNVILDIQEGGSTAGVSALQAGTADLAAVSWHPKDAAMPPGYQRLPSVVMPWP